jgi:hypothetical protein
MQISPARRSSGNRARHARERHETFRVTHIAPKPHEASGPDATSQELAELALDERRHATGPLRDSEIRREMSAHDAVKNGVLGGADTIRVDAVACCASRGVSPQRFVAASPFASSTACRHAIGTSR